MNAPIRLLRLGRVPWRASQAVYHAAAECMSEGDPDTIILAVPAEPYFCVGFHQHPGDFLDLAHCHRNGLGILRRRVGGGAVYLDKDQLFFQCIFHRSRAPMRVDRLFETFLGPAAGALRRLGYPAELQGANEITIGGRRISGTGAGQIEEASVVVGNVLVDFPYEEMVRAWRVPSEPFRRMAEAGIRTHVTTLRGESAVPPAMDELEDVLIDAYAEALGRPLVEGRFSGEEEDAIARLERELTDPVWLGEHPSTSDNRRLKIARGVFVCEVSCAAPAGRVTITARLNKRHIEDIEIRDAGGTVIPDDWSEALRGACLLRPRPIAAALRKLGVLDDVDAVLETLAAGPRED